MGNLKTLLMVVLLLAILMGGGAYWNSSSRKTPTPWPSIPAVPAIPATPSPSVSPLVSAPAGSRTPLPKPKRIVDREQEWKNFDEKFGPDLKPEFLKSGQLVSIRGVPGKGKVDHDFRPEDPAKAIARAREIISGLESLLGVRPDWPLGNAAAKGSPLSAQVFFNESHEGIVLEPVGNIKVDLGSKGELIALYSDYAAHVSVTNEVRLDSDQAQVKALAKAQEFNNGNSQTAEGGSKVIWLIESDEARIAYQFMVQGRQIIIDAQNGRVIFTRDRRQF